MSRFQLKTTCHTKTHGGLKLNEKRQSTDANAEMTEMWQFSDKDIEAVIMKMLQWADTNVLKCPWFTAKEIPELKRTKKLRQVARAVLSRNPGVHTCPVLLSLPGALPKTRRKRRGSPLLPTQKSLLDSETNRRPASKCSLQDLDPWIWAETDKWPVLGT